MAKINEKPSKHFRKRHSVVDTLVIHYISVINILPRDPFNVEQCLKLLTKPIPYRTKNGILKHVKVSAHYTICREGEIYRHVSESNTAWACGVSNLRGRSTRNSCNDFSISIELIGGRWIEFSDQQYDSLIKLTSGILFRHKIIKENIVGHEHIAPKRKIDPGKLFDWDRYFNGVYPNKVKIFNPDIVKFDKKEFKIEQEAAQKSTIVKDNDITKGKEDHLIIVFIKMILKIFKIGKK